MAVSAREGSVREVQQASTRELQAKVPHVVGAENSLREARRSEPALCAGGQGGRAARPCRNTIHAGGSENVAPHASTQGQRNLQRGRAGTQSARNGLRSVGASMVGKSNGSGMLPGPSPRSAAAAATTQQFRGTLGDITNGQANRKQSKTPAGQQFQNGSSVTLSPSACCCAATLPAAALAEAAMVEEELSAVFKEDVQDLQKVGEYAPDIFKCLLEKEGLWLPKSDYMEKQADINGKMRAILIDWLVEVHMKYHLRPETLFLTVNIIDRYLSFRHIARKKLQLLGVVAMLIAAKFEEIDPPRVQEYAYITDNTYSKKEIVDMEAAVLGTLSFNIAVPTPAHFVDRLLRANVCDAMHRSLAQYALELALLDLRSLRYPPSLLVGAAILLSNNILGRRPAWSATLAHCTKLPEASVWACAEELRGFMETAKTAPLQAVRRKYQLDQHHAVANLTLVGLRG